MLEVLEPGLLTTVQDAGRPGYVHLGLPPAGACDPQALETGNALLDNDPGDACLEVTLGNASFRALATCVLAVTGADLGARIDEDPSPIEPGQALLLRQGSELRFTGRIDRGFRAYLCVPGGINVPEILGSRSTYLPAALGGLEGRALRAGDRLQFGRPDDRSAAGRNWPTVLERDEPTQVPRLRVIPGPHVERLGSDVLKRFLDQEWHVSGASDRTGLRLEGTALGTSSAEAGELLSAGVTWGAVQLPPGGEPICLLADHQTVGGYPVLAVVARVDHPALAQLAPSDRVRFLRVGVEEAQKRYRAQRSRLRAAQSQLTEGLWDRLTDAAGQS